MRCAQNASVRELVDLLAEGKTVTYKVTIPEGLTSQQIVDRLKADPNLSGEITATPAEGSAAAGNLRRSSAAPHGKACSTAWPPSRAS